MAPAIFNATPLAIFNVFSHLLQLLHDHELNVAASPVLTLVSVSVSTYSQELRKIKESKKSVAGTDSVYTPSVKWFTILDECLGNMNAIIMGSESNLVQNLLVYY
ncbi:uncharacterized protein [Palaemon carinicauda]|uniref:uncharacterized protein n=1 Tax=Palaemon carinicauda TaxID=392227 RepID=UPI0035B673E7